MAVDLGTAYLSVSASTRGVDKSIKSGLSGAGAAGSKAGGLMGVGLLATLGRFAGPIAAVVGVGGIIKGAKASVAAFSDLNAQVKALQRTAGGTVQQASALSGALQLSGVDSAKASISLRMFSRNLANSNDGGKKAAAMQAVLGGSFTDSTGKLKSLNDILPMAAKRFAAMPDGPEKTALAMKLFGRSGAEMLPFLNKGSAGIAELQAKAKSLGLVLDDGAQKKWMAYRVATRQVSATMQGLKVTIGGALIPIFTAFAGFITNSVGPAISGFIQTIQNSKGLQAFVTSVSTALTGLGTTIGSAFSGNAGGATSAISGIMTLLSPFGMALKAIQPILPQIAASFQAVGSQIGATLIPVLAQIAPVVQQVVGVLAGGLQQVILALLPAIVQLASAILPVVAQVIAAIVPVFMQLVQAILPIVPIFAQLVTALVPPFVGLIQALLPAVMPLIQAIMGIGSALMPIVSIIIQFVGSLIPPLMSVINALVPPIAQLVSQLASALMPVFEAVGQLISALMPIIQLLVQVISSIIGAVMPVVSAILGALIPVLTVIITVVAKVLSAIISFVVGGIAGIGKWVTGVVQGIAKGVAVFGQVKGKILEAFLDPGKWLIKIGGDIINGLWKGINDTLGWLRKQLSNAMEMLPQWLKNIFQIHSPSRVFAKIGGQLMAGLAAGISTSSSTVTAQLDALAANITRAATKSTKGMKKLAAAAAGMVAAQKTAHETWWSDDKISAASLSRMLAGRASGATLADFQQARNLLAGQISDARQTLDQLKQSRDQMAQGISSSIIGEFDLKSAGRTPGKIAANVTAVAGRAMRFAGKLKELSAAGWPPALVQEIAGYGSVDGLRVAGALLSASASEKSTIIGGYGSLTSWAGQAGNAVADQMYGVGIAAQQGLVDGLLSQDAKLVKAAEQLASTMTKAIKRKLGIHSPSTVFRDEVGLPAAQGAADGMTAGKSIVARASAALVSTASLNVASSGGFQKELPQTFNVYEAISAKDTAEKVARRQRFARV